MTKPWFFSVTFIGLLTAAFSLAACGGSGGGSPPAVPTSANSPTVPPSSAPSATPTPTTAPTLTPTPLPSAQPSSVAVVPPTPVPGASIDPAESLCGRVDIEGPGEPQQPENSCSSGTTDPSKCVGSALSVFDNWGSLQVVLCNSTGIPAAGLNGFLVQNPLTHPNDIDAPLRTCQNDALGKVAFAPGFVTVTGAISGAFYVSQTTPDWWYGTPENSNQCAVAIWDTHQPFAVVGVDFQLSGGCANTSCSAGMARRRIAFHRGR